MARHEALFDMTPDRTDMRILRQIENDGRVTKQHLTNAVARLPSVCMRQVKLLEDECCIAGYGCAIAPKRIGVEFEALVHVSMRPDVEEAC